MERDILRLHMILRKSQTEVAKILGVSQPTVNYRYRRARERLDFMEKLPAVTGDEIRRVLKELGAREQDVEAMVLYIETNSQSEVARRMDTSQGAVRHWIHRGLVNHLQNDFRSDDVHRRVRTACGMLVSRPGIFNEPQKPGHVPKHQKVEQRLPQAPRMRGDVVEEGRRVLFLEGVYARLEALVLEVNAETVRARLDLESQEVTLVWPRPNSAS
jgi:DNA-binding CsgD family transcriptional regulator